MKARSYKIVNARPPIYSEIAAAFRLDAENAHIEPVFAWGDTIYNPHGTDIPPHLIAHEQVHMERQGDDVVGWWRRYIKDPQFRLEEEILAHAMEYRTMCDFRGCNRPFRRRAIKIVAARLAAPLYSLPISASKAKKRILELA